MPKSPPLSLGTAVGLNKLNRHYAVQECDAREDDSSNEVGYTQKLIIMANEFLENRYNITRKHFLGKLSIGLGSVALGSLLIKDLFRGGADEIDAAPLLSLSQKEAEDGAGPS